MRSFLNFHVTILFLISLRLAAADISTLDHDSLSLLFDDFKCVDLQSCRLVCYQWRVTVDWYLRNRTKRKKIKPVLCPLEEFDFLRIASIDHALQAYERGEYAKAFELFSKAASHEQGNAHAGYMTGHMFLLGRGVSKSVREGLYQLSLAADAGYLPALYDLGLIFHTGNDSEGNTIIDIDYEKAFVYYRQAHAKGHINATYHLGLIYYQGKYIKTDLKRGLELIRTAAEKGDKNAIKTLSIIESTQ